MPHRRSTFSKFIIENERRGANPDPDLTGLLNDIQTSCKFIASAVSRGALIARDDTATSVNVQGEDQKPLDVVANEIILETCEWGGQLCGMASEEMEQPYSIPAEYPKGSYLLLFDPLDGSSNIDVNVTVGTIFSILRAPPGVTHPTVADFLQPGTKQIAAGFALYGPTSMIVITLGGSVHGFTLDREIGDLHVNASQHAHSRDDLRVCDQCIERTLLGAARQALRRGVHPRQVRATRSRLQYALDRVTRCRDLSHLDSRRSIHVSARYQGHVEAGPPAPNV